MIRKGGSGVETVRIGMLIPSSNTVAEPVTNRLLHGVPGVSVHYARVRVTEIALSPASDAQFAAGPMLEAASLLADAGVRLIVWNGTAGSWLGIDHDRRLCEAIERGTGIPATTSTMAILDAVRACGIRRLAIVTPYTADVNERIAAVYEGFGIRSAGAVGRGLTVNRSFADLSEDEIVRMIGEAAAMPGADGVAVVCTNMRGARAAAEAERRLKVPVLDSVAVTVGHALRLAGYGGVRPEENRGCISAGRRRGGQGTDWPADAEVPGHCRRR
jgi:maleate isomerase